MPLPTVIWLRDKGSDPDEPDAPVRPVVLGRFGTSEALIADPAVEGGRPADLTRDALLARWNGELMLVASRASLVGELAHFDFSWFIPALVKHRRLLGEVLLISFFLQLLRARVSPLFFQVVMDKVLVHRGLTTLHVLVVGLVVVMRCSRACSPACAPTSSATPPAASTWSWARGCSVTWPPAAGLLPGAARGRLGGPRARAGDASALPRPARRSPLVLDLFFSIVFLAVMFRYSAAADADRAGRALPLLLVLLSVLIVPVLRGRLNEKFARGAENQACWSKPSPASRRSKASALRAGTWPPLGQAARRPTCRPASARRPWRTGATRASTWSASWSAPPPSGGAPSW